MGTVYRHLYPQVYEWENLLLAWSKARKGKRGGCRAAAFEMNAAENLLTIQQELAEKTYQPGAYVSFHIHEPKRRLISAAPFRDRVVHHALCNLMEPLFERRFIHDSYANRRGKGTLMAGCRLGTSPDGTANQRGAGILRCRVWSSQAASEDALSAVIKLEFCFANAHKPH